MAGHLKAPVSPNVEDEVDARPTEPTVVGSATSGSSPVGTTPRTQDEDDHTGAKDALGPLPQCDRPRSKQTSCSRSVASPSAASNGPGTAPLRPDLTVPPLSPAALALLDTSLDDGLDEDDFESVAIEHLARQRACRQMRNSQRSLQPVHVFELDGDGFDDGTRSSAQRDERPQRRPRTAMYQPSMTQYDIRPVTAQV